jgi:hypothetical protein
MRAVQFVAIEKKPDRRSHPTRLFLPDVKCAWHHKGDTTHKRAKWMMRIIVDWKPDSTGHPVCEDCKAEWESDNLVLPPHVVVGKPGTTG